MLVMVILLSELSLILFHTHCSVILLYTWYLIPPPSPDTQPSCCGCYHLTMLMVP